MVVVLTHVEQLKGADLLRVRRLVHQSEWAPQESFLLTVEEVCHRAHESQLQKAIPVEPISVGDTHAEVPIDAHILHFLNEFFAVAVDSRVEGADVPRHHLDLVARLDLRVFALPFLTGVAATLGRG